MKVAQRMITATAILVFGTAMYACGGGKSLADGTLTQGQFNTLLASAAPFTAVQDGVTAVKGSVSKLTLIGTVHGTARATDAVSGRVTEGASAASFGPCADMGLYSGQGGSDSANPLRSQFEIYKQTADPVSGCPGATTSYNETTGLHDRLPFAAWSQPNCQGTMYVETDVPQNTMSLNALEGILVILSPDSSDNTVYASNANSVPQPIQIQSAFNALGGVCTADVETRMAIPLFKNDFHVSGVPDSLVPGSWSKVAP